MRQYGVMTTDVKLLGTGLRLSLGEVVVLTPATNQPTKDTWFARPRGAVWDGGDLRVGPEDSILLDQYHVVLLTPQQKHAYLMMCRRWNRRPQVVQQEVCGPAIMCDFGEMWLGIEKDGYVHS
jgi:hypothetical protein